MRRQDRASEHWLLLLSAPPCWLHAKPAAGSCIADHPRRASRACLVRAGEMVRAAGGEAGGGGKESQAAGGKPQSAVHWHLAMLCSSQPADSTAPLTFPIAHTLPAHGPAAKADRPGTRGSSQPTHHYAGQEAAQMQNGRSRKRGSSQSAYHYGGCEATPATVQPEAECKPAAGQFSGKDNAHGMAGIATPHM